MEAFNQLLNTGISKISPYSGFLLVGIYVGMFIIAFVIIKAIIRKTQQAMQDVEKINKANLKNINIRKVKASKYSEIIRTAIAPDGIDPNTLSYFTIMDGGHEKYIRTYTISEKPKRTVFGKTFTPLFNFPGCTSSVFINPRTDEEMSHKFDKNNTILEAEYMRADGDPNRQRKLAAQISEVNEWAGEVETGENKFFEVNFLFSLAADSIQELNKTSDSFYNEALARGIQVTSCYGLEAEAYALNSPLNGHVNIMGRSIKSKPGIPLMMDKYSLSTLVNYLQASFTHRIGIPLGRDMITQSPVVFSLFEPSHDSYSLAIAGKPGSGKSLLIKVMAARQLIFGWHYVAIDSQQKKGTSEGEYAALAAAAGGVNFRLMSGTNECLNLFDISESIRSEKLAEDTFKEIRTVDINGKISTLSNNLCSMILTSATGSFDSISDKTYIQRIIIDTALQTYEAFGIIDGEVESLYESGTRKKLPTITDFYKRILRNAAANKDVTFTKAYSLIVNALKDYVKELYYTRDTITFLSRDAYNKLPIDENGSKYFPNPKTQQREDVVAIRGVKSYYDGQSTIAVTRDIPFVNFDISMMPDADRTLARQVCMSWITENFIKKNSERLDASNKLIFILDEVHECYRDDFARSTIDITVRECRKRFCGVILSTQTLAEYNNWPETQSILKLVECKFVFRQDYQDRDYLIESLGITESQADMIVGYIGGSDRDMDKKKHRGEMCIIDNKKVCFVKVDYLRHTEEIIAETNAAEAAKKLKLA